MNPVGVIDSVISSLSSSKSALQNRYRIGDIGDPYGIPKSTFSIFDVKSNSLIEVDLSLRKLQTHPIILLGTFLFLRLWINLLWETLSNTFQTSSANRDGILPKARIARILSFNRYKAVSVDLLGRALNQVFRRRLFLSEVSLSLVAIILSRAFPRVFNRAIGLQEPGLE